MVYDDIPGAEVEYSGTVERRKDQEMDTDWHQWSAMSIVINLRISHCTGLQSSRREAEGEAGVGMGLGGGASQPRKQKSQLFIFGYGMESFKWIILDIPLLGPGAAKESFIFLFKSSICSLLKYPINQHVLRPNNIFQASHNPWRIQVPQSQKWS